MHIPTCSYLVLGLAAAFACGGKPPTNSVSPSGGDSGTLAADMSGEVPDGGAPPGPDLATTSSYQTPFPPTLPQVLAGTGRVLANPTVVPVFFPRDALESGVVSFLQNFASRSALWSVAQEYGVSRATIAATVVVSQSLAASVSDADIQTFLAARLQDGTLPRVTGNTLYMLYLASGVTVTIDGGVSCRDLGGYHNTARISGSNVPYAVLPRCSASNLAPLTYASAHEMIEATADPDLNAHNQLSAPYGMWLFALFGSEIGDLCQNLSDSAINENGVGVITRVWSNAAAAARKNPCQPAPAGAAFFSVPILTEERVISINGVSQNVESVAVAPGGSTTVAVRLLSDTRPSPTWSVTAQEVPLPSATGGMGTAVLTLSWQEAPGRTTTSGQDGSTLHLQLSAAASAPTGYTTVRLTSTGPTASGGQTQTQWVAAVRIGR